MNHTTQGLIGDFAEKLFETMELKVPVRVESLVEAPEGTLTEGPAHVMESHARITGPGTFEICVPKCSDAQRRLLVAKELGHLLLHIGFGDFTGSGERGPEPEAYEFATALLMPESEYVAKLEELTTGTNQVDVRKLAEHFGVPIHAARHRGQVLGRLFAR